MSQKQQGNIHVGVCAACIRRANTTLNCYIQFKIQTVHVSVACTILYTCMQLILSKENTFCIFMV